MKKRINVFIVEDNPVFAQVLKSYIENAFKHLFVRVFSFGTGEECMASFSQVLPDLVILDYSLNSRSPSAANGLQILDQIKAQRFETSVIMLTSNDHIDTALRSFHDGADDYIVKTGSPFKAINHSISKIFAKKERTLITIEKELLFQNEEKEKRASEMLVANSQVKIAERSKMLIEEKNRDITDSINYASKIQQAKLPQEEEISSVLTDCFVLFKPKDIVSGDFYFFHKRNEFLFIAAADCTGHGVPGALMSMIGSGKLEEAVTHSSDTSEILQHLNKGIRSSLHQSNGSGSTRDGMDIAICSVDLEKRVIRYSGANRPFWLIRSNRAEVEEIKGTKTAIGGLTEDSQSFDSHELKLMKGDTFYISTDGYADQFGGKYGKKLMTRQFKKILLDISDMPMPDQKKHLDEFLESWKAGVEQVDDILVIGVRL